MLVNKYYYGYSNRKKHVTGKGFVDSCSSIYIDRSIGQLVDRPVGRSVGRSVFRSVGFSVGFRSVGRSVEIICIGFLFNQE